MLLEIYSVRDSGAAFFHPPFFVRAKGQALREFNRLTNDPKSIIYPIPEQFDLYYLGKWSDNDGKADLLPSPQHITKAIEQKNTQLDPVQES